jgi:catechol 2,3-dioxygenase-like lactoylglutathione lyase family enzyme
MVVELNHTIVKVRDKAASVAFYAEVLGIGEVKEWGRSPRWSSPTLRCWPSWRKGPVHSQHSAFLVSEERFDAIRERIVARGLTYWGTPCGGESTSTSPRTAAAGSTGRTRTTRAGRATSWD